MLIPPDSQAEVAEEQAAVARFLARWLDDWLRIPGTNFKIGLDPLLALFPGLGSALASGGGLLILAEAVRSGVGLAVLLRMGGNLLINALLDFLPAGGPVLSAFFKSNRRNLRLLQDWQAGRRDEVRRGTRLRFLVLALVFAALMALLLGLWLASAWLMSRLFQAWAA
jgi:hypothetical protein